MFNLQVDYSSNDITGSEYINLETHSGALLRGGYQRVGRVYVESL